MNRALYSRLSICLFMNLSVSLCCLTMQSAEPSDPQDQTPRIACVVPQDKQSHFEAKTTIWYDDFNAAEWKHYKEKSGTLDPEQNYGDTHKERSRALRMFYPKGKKGSGGAKVFFGDAPYGGDAIVRRGEAFREIYIRLYVRHQPGWHGGSPAKLLRATSMAGSNWSQAMIAHVWGGKNKDCLTLDPVRAVKDGKVTTSKYNDWDGLKWLGNSPAGRFPLSSTAESGVWYAVEMRVKLNTPGKSDGINQLWVDGRLDCERRGLNFIGTYEKHSLNAVFIEAYWNSGAPADLYRWYDNFVIATEPIGPICAPAQPTLIRARRPWEADDMTWQCQIASARHPDQVSFISEATRSDRISVDPDNGVFSNGHQLRPGTYYCRARKQNAEGEWTAWSKWHQAFRVKAQ